MSREKHFNIYRLCFGLTVVFVVSLSLLVLVSNPVSAWTTKPPVCDLVGGTDDYGLFEGWQQEVADTVFDSSPPDSFPASAGMDWLEWDFIIGRTVGAYNNENQGIYLFVRNPATVSPEYAELYLKVHTPSSEVAFGALDPPSGNDNGTRILLDNETGTANRTGVWSTWTVDGGYNHSGLNSMTNANKYECVSYVKLSNYINGLENDYFPTYVPPPEPECEDPELEYPECTPPEPPPVLPMTQEELDESIRRAVATAVTFGVAGWVILWFWGPNKWR